MDKFLTYTAEQLERAIRETAARMQLHPTPVEKDFWVCWLLRELFSLTCVQGQLIFKGGTSLSKGYGVIERFSEDIDLSVHASAFWVAIEPNFDDLSKSQRDFSLFAYEFISIQMGQNPFSAGQRVQRKFAGDFHLALN